MFLFTSFLTQKLNQYKKDVFTVKTQICGKTVSKRVFGQKYPQSFQMKGRKKKVGKKKVRGKRKLEEKVRVSHNLQ